MTLCYPIHQAANAQSSAPEDQPKPAKNAQPAPPNAIQNELARIARAVEASQRQDDPKAAEERTKRDLQAQEDMAWWAMWMFIAAAVSTVLSVLGVFLIWRSLVHTRAAAKHAGDAVIETRSIGQAQVRAYLSIEAPTIELFPTHDYPYVSIVVVNSGHSPARQFRWTQTISYASSSGIQWKHAPMQMPELGRDIPIGNTGPLKVARAEMPDAETMRSLRSEGLVTVRVVIEAAWEDVFGNAFQEIYHYQAVRLAADFTGEFDLFHDPAAAHFQQ